MKDLINRQAALREYQSVCYGINCGACPFLTEDEDKLCKLELWIHGLPSAQPEPQWIPCEERLPEVGRNVLFSVGGMRTEEGCLRPDGEWGQFHRGYIQSNAVVSAWMPLPEPYGGEQE